MLLGSIGEPAGGFKPLSGIPIARSLLKGIPWASYEVNVLANRKNRSSALGFPLVFDLFFCIM
jgi:hypothetical protein